MYQWQEINRVTKEAVRLITTLTGQANITLNTVFKESTGNFAMTYYGNVSGFKVLSGVVAQPVNVPVPVPSEAVPVAPSR